MRGGEPGDVQVPDTFDSFYRKEYQSMVALAYGLSGRRAVAEEIAQDAFLRALHQWDRIRVMDSPGGWLRTVTMNLARSRWRRWRAEVAALLRMDSMEPPSVDSPDLEGEDFWKQVARLPGRQAQVVALHYIDDRSIADIAALLGVAEGTVKATLHQARRKLAGLLDEEGWTRGL